MLSRCEVPFPLLIAATSALAIACCQIMLNPRLKGENTIFKCYIEGPSQGPYSARMPSKAAPLIPTEDPSQLEHAPASQA